jgi:hypothetical protein
MVACSVHNIEREILGVTAASMKVTDVCDVAPCVLLQIHRRFRGVYCLSYKHDHSSPASLIDIS